MDSSSSSSTRNLDGGSGGGEEDTFTSHEHRSRCCFQEWMQLQRQDLTQLLQSLHHTTTDQIKSQIQNCITHFEDYIATRSRLAEEGAAPFFAPTWCTSLENSLLWIAGCRPTIFIRLLYAMTGLDVEARAGELLEGLRKTGPNCNSLHVGDLTPAQMGRVNELHIRTIRAEEKLTSEMASYQEEMADQPIAVIANEMEGVGEVSDEAEKALKNHEEDIRGIMEKADDLRLKTLKELVLHILEPLQAVEFLVASKKLHLSLHLWGKRRDQIHGRKPC